MSETGRSEYADAADDVTISRHPFSVEHELNLFPLDMCEIRCPDCDRTAYPDDLGEALDWALGHKCDPDEDAAPEADGTEMTDA